MQQPGVGVVAEGVLVVQQVFEAAAIDGAGPFRLFWSVVLGVFLGSLAISTLIPVVFFLFFQRLFLSGAGLGGAGAIQVTASELELPMAFGGPHQLTRLRGELVASGKLDLSKLHQVQRLVGLPIERSTGNVRFELLARNESAQGRPELALQVDTNGLRIVEQRRQEGSITTTAAAVESKPFALEGIDGHAALRFDPEHGEIVGTLIARDRGGTLAQLEGELLLPETWDAQRSAARTLLEMPCRLHLQVEGRRLQSLPPLVRPPSLRGRLALSAEVSGTLAQPGQAAANRVSSARAPIHV